MSFITPGTGPTRSTSPETLFRDLSRTPEGPRHLWAHQADILRAYMDHVADPDLAVELPTGAGKTLVGMLIAEWRRRTRSERVVYLCPTVQLARQALHDAKRSGIPVVDLTGSARHWSAGGELAYRSAEALAVAHYGALFNSNPAFNDAHLLVFDDAHAAAGTIADAWTVRFGSRDGAYVAIATLLRDGLPTAAADRYISRQIIGSQWQDSHMVAPETVAQRADELAALVRQFAADSDQRFGWQMISESLDACAVFIAADELIIRPVLPPTTIHRAFTEPRQRLYLSATLGSGGELERAFGRNGITRMPVPAGWDERGTGRRFFVFPELIREFADAASDEAVKTEMHRFVTRLMRVAERTLLLTPSSRLLEQTKTAIVDNDFSVVEAPAIRESLEPFLNQQAPAVLALANRYDGIDLPDRTCRAIVMAGLPVGADAQERFFAFTLGAKRALQERTRTRFAQGSGRATRNTNDWSLVIVLGRELVAFCGQKDAQVETHPEIRAELEFGLTNSQGRTADEVLANTTSFLAQDETWRDVAEPALRMMREDAHVERQADTMALAASAPYEVRAVDSAWRGDWQRAVTNAERALAALAGGSELRPYQAFWNYLAAQWAREASNADPAYADQAAKMARAADAAAARTTWMPNKQGRVFDGIEADVDQSPLDAYAARAVVSLAKELGKPRTVNRLVTGMLENLQGTKAADYEAGLVDLGRLLGATANKPAGEARADALWRWSDHLWIAWEAKSEVKEKNSVSATTIRQANTHLRAAAADLDEELPQGSVNVLVTPQASVDPSAVALAEESLCLALTTDIAALAERVANVWMSLQGRLLSEATPEDLVSSVLAAFQSEDVAPSTVIPRLRGSLF